ncbi:MAG: VanZ family protein [Gemmatimonadaceae bacterium]
MKGWRGILLAGSLLFIAAATLTPGTPFSPGLLRPGFWCWACGSEGAADVTLNIALFLPFGFALALLGVSPLRALIIGMLLSMAVEGAQRLGLAPDRVASATDIVTNTAGAFVGALIGRYRALLLHPTPRIARMLAAIGVVKVCAFLAFTAWALGPDNSNKSLPASVGNFQLSRFPFTPGYGWYHGLVSETTIGEQSYAHTGDGPVILHGTVQAELRGSVKLSGRDERPEFVPLLYVHDLRVIHPELLLGQQATDARLFVNLRGRQFRFPGPSILLRGAFPEHANDAQMLSFTVTPRLWTLTANSARGTISVALPISLSLGWTLLQTVVHVGDRGSWALSILWLFVMWLPVGYWCTFAGRDDSTIAVVSGVTAMVLALWLLPQIGTIARCSPLEWGSALSGLASGVFFATRSRARRRGIRVISPAAVT